MSTDLLEAYRLLIADVYELAGTSRSTSEQMARRHGCTAAQWHVLSVLSDSDMTVAAASRRLGLSRQAVQRVVNDLIDRGHLRSHPNPNDRRAPLIALTEAGKKSVRRLFDDSDSNRAAMLEQSGLRRRDLEKARATLRCLVKAYGREEPDDS